MLRNLFLFCFAPSRLKTESETYRLGIKSIIFYDYYANVPEVAIVQELLRRFGNKAPMGIGDYSDETIAWFRASSVVASIPQPVSAKLELDSRYPVIRNRARRRDTNGV